MSLLTRLYGFGRSKWLCPICDYHGPFWSVRRPTGRRRHAKCPDCGALERHRIQYVVTQGVLESIDPSNLRMLHFAPEAFFRRHFEEAFGGYETADLFMEGVDHQVDIQGMPFEDQSYDVVYASHVLEHIPDDQAAVAEIRRILRPGGVAILPVPLVAAETIEYPEPNPHEAFHVRAPGPDYYDRYRAHFGSVVTHESSSLPKEHQLFVYEDRTKWPTAKCPLRPMMDGERHEDVVPVCYV